MTLDPAASPWPGVLSSTVICLWMAAIGAPLAHAAFAHRPRSVWPFYAPILGVVAVLLTTNLAAYVVPGAASAWIGLAVPTAFSAAVAWRSGAIHRPSRRLAVGFLVLISSAAALCVFALANRTHVWFVDESWHFALAQRMARGVFPPVTPYGVDAGIGYHYGADLLAASVLSTTSTPVWTTYYVLLSFLTVALLLVAVGFAWDSGAPLPLAIGIGAALGFFAGHFHVGLPPYVDSPEDVRGFAGYLAGLTPEASAHANERLAFKWVEQPQWSLAAAAFILVAAALEAGVARRHAAVVAAGAGVSALAEAAMLVFASAALGALGAVRLARLHGRERYVLAGALVVAALLIVLAGGPISDEVFGRGGTTGMVRIDVDPRAEDLAPFGLAGPALIQVGIIPLVAIGAFAAYRRRSWGLAYLTLAGALGLVEAEILRSVRPANDQRILWLATVVAMFAALAGTGALVGGLPGRRKWLVVLALGLFALLPTIVPRAISGTQLARGGLNLGHPAGTQSIDRFAVRTQFGSVLKANWDVYEWLARSLPNDARLLTSQPAGVASLAGIASPTSGRHLQSLAQYATPIYEDALRFLHRDDLEAMGITHLHVTDAHAAVLTPEARVLLDDPAQFKLLVDMRSASGMRHRVFKVLPGAGTTDVAASSFRRLRQIVSADTPVSLVGSLSLYGRRMLLFNFVDHGDLRAPASTDVNRATRAASFNTELGISDIGVVVVPELIEPITLGLSADDAVWTGYGMRVYRPSHPAGNRVREPRVAGLGFDGQVDGDRAVVNLWYRNPHRLPFVTGTELRLYEADATGTGPADPDLSRFVRWWDGPLALAPESQVARIRFDARRLEINATAGAGGDSGLEPGRSFLLMFTVAGFDPASGQVDVLQLVPLARVDVSDAGVAYDAFSGIVALEPLLPGSRAVTRLERHHGWLGVDMDLTPLRASTGGRP